MPNVVETRPSRPREFPREPYASASVFGVLLLIVATMLFLPFFGINAIGLSGASSGVQLLYAVLTGLAIATPIAGIRALFGNHPFALIALTACAVILFAGALVGEPLGAAPLTTLAVGPALVVFLVALFAAWKWVTTVRHR